MLFRVLHIVMHYRILKVHHIKLALWITCSTVKENALLMRNISVEIGKVGYSDDIYFIAMVTLDMICTNKDFFSQILCPAKF